MSSFTRYISLSSYCSNKNQAYGRTSPSISGKALLLDGATGYVLASNSASITTQFGFTAEAWVKPITATMSGDIFSKISSTQNGFWLTMRTASIGQNKFAAIYDFAVNDGNCIFHTIENNLQPLSESDITKWQHVAGVVQSDGQMDIFVNGQRSTSNFNSISPGTCPREMPVTIGARSLTGGSDGFFPGLIDEARISSISRYINKFNPPQSPLIPDQNTVLLYHMDSLDGNGNLIDSSGNGHYGIINGNVTLVASDLPYPEPLATPTSIFVLQHPFQALLLPLRQQSLLLQLCYQPRLQLLHRNRVPHHLLR